MKFVPLLTKVVKLAEETAEETEAASKSFDFKALLHSIVEWLSTEGIKIVLGLIVLFILFKVVNFIARRIQRIMEKKHADKTIETVVVNVFRKGLKIILFVAYLGFLGFETSSVAAVIASLGVGLGLALQGALSNLAGGLIILVMRPFKLGDYIASNGQEGTVEEIKIFYTYIVTVDNKVVMIPNGNVANGTIVNYSTKDTRRVDLQFSISYEDDFKKAKELIMECIKKVGLSLENPVPFVNISSHNVNSIDITTRVWCKSDDYWTIYWAMLEEVRASFAANGISVPYQKVEVEIKNK